MKRKNAYFVLAIMFFAAVLQLSALFAAAAAPVVPVVNNSTINYSLSPNQITVNGSGFKPSSTAPTVLFNNVSLRYWAKMFACFVCTDQQVLSVGKRQDVIWNQICAKGVNELLFDAGSGFAEDRIAGGIFHEKEKVAVG